MFLSWMTQRVRANRFVGVSVPRPVTRLQLLGLEDRSVPSTSYLATDLISDQPGVAPVTDPTLVNAWGIALNPNGPFWISSNGKDLSEVYTGDHNGAPIGQPFKVAIPSGGTPTGQVFNGTTDFVVTDGTHSGPAAFIFASESGAVTGWSPAVPPPPPSKQAQPAFAATDGAVYKGIAMANNGSGNFLYLADFHNNKIDILDGKFKQVQLGTNGFGMFSDPNLPRGYAPFNVAVINNKLYVSYAKQDDAAHDDVAGHGHGIIDVFDLNGTHVQRLVSHGELNSPWGMVLAPSTFGQFGGDLLVGNFGDGRIHAYDPSTGRFLGTLEESPGHPLVIDGLWGLAFGGGNVGVSGALYYAAGPDGESHGLFGRISANAEGTNPVTATVSKGDLVITGSRDNDKVEVELNRAGDKIVVENHEQKIGEFDLASISTIHFNGLAGDDVFVVDPRIDVTTVADGGAGNDVLIAGGGPSIEVGGLGNDVLVGGSGRDLLIGGDGKDVIVGRGGDDILVGGSTAYDANQAQLMQILNAWNGPGSYNDRVAAIRSGANGVPKLDATTVTDDGVRDDLFGGPGLDWFFATGPDRIHDKIGPEQVN